MTPDLKFEKHTRLPLIAFALLFGVAFTALYKVSDVNSALVAVLDNNSQVSMLAAAAAQAGSDVFLQASTNPLVSQSNVVSQYDALEFPVAVFTLRGQGGDSKLLTVNATSTATGTSPVEFNLYEGNNKISSVATAGPSIQFTQLDRTASPILNNTLVTYTIKAKYPLADANFMKRTSLRVWVGTVKYISSTNRERRAMGPMVPNARQYFYTKAAISRVSNQPRISTTPDGNGRTDLIRAHFEMNVQAVGGAVVMPKYSDFEVVFASSSVGTKYRANGGSVTIIPNGNIADGSVATVSVDAYLTGSSSIPVSGMYGAYIRSIKWNAGNGVVLQNYGLENFKTPLVAVTR